MLKLNPQLPLPTREYILSNISDYQIYEKYWPEFNLEKRRYNSPLRLDKIPSFCIFPSNQCDRLFFYDQVTQDKGDCFVFVSKLYKISFKDTLFKICSDFGLTDEVFIPSSFKADIKKKVSKKVVNYSTVSKSVSIKVKTRDFNELELKWWKEYGISLETLNKYWVFALERLFINEWITHCNSHTFGYLERKENTFTWKIYKPLEENKEDKWINNNDKSVIQGYSQLPQTSDILILSKALKDSMSIVENANIASCSLQSESGDIKVKVMKELKERFSKIYILFDSDKWGIKYGNELAQKHEIIPIFIPHPQYKDFSDLYKGVGKEYSIKILNKLINKQ